MTRTPEVGDVWLEKEQSDCDPRRIIMFLIGPYGKRTEVPPGP